MKTAVVTIVRPICQKMWPRTLLNVTFGDESYREEIDLTAEDGVNLGEKVTRKS